MLETLKQIDTSFFLFLNGIHSPFWDTIMWHVSGKLEWIPLYAFLIYLVIRKYKMKAVWVILAIVLVITLADQISVKLFKMQFERPRPCHNPEIQHLVHKVNDKCGGRFGFVSSHAANSFALAMFMTLLFRKRVLGFLIFFWAAVVSYSRIYLGVHYPGDIFGGAILGMLIGWGVFGFYSLLIKKYLKNSETIPFI